MPIAPCTARWFAHIGRQLTAHLTIVLLLLVAAVPAAIAQTAGIKVSSILFEGQPARQVSNVQVRPPGTTRAEAQIIAIGQVLTPGAELTLPRGATVTLLTSNDNQITLRAGARYMVGVVTAQGESHQPQSGQIEFTIKNALNFFNVSHDRFTAAVKGTAYSVDIEPGKALKFSVSEGVVAVERQVRLRPTGGDGGAADPVNSQDAEISVVEDLKAGQTKTYSLYTVEYLAEFKNFGEAEA